MKKTEVTSSCTAGCGKDVAEHVTAQTNGATDAIAQPIKIENFCFLNVDNPETDNSAIGIKPEIKIEDCCKPSSASMYSHILEEELFANVEPLSSAESVEMNSTARPPGLVIMEQNLENSTASSQSAQPAKKKRGRKPSRPPAVSISEQNLGNSTASSQSAQPAKKKRGRKPSTVCKVTAVKTEKPSSENNDDGTAPALLAKKTKLLKKDNFKPQRSVFIPVSSETLDHKGSFFTRGDIVSILGMDDRVYYAQIRGLLKSQYGEKSAVLTWLFPTTESPKEKFDPDTYVIGFEEDIPRDLEYLEFVCHAPTEYFKCSNPSYPELSQKPVLGFAQTRKGYVIVKLPFEDFSTDSE